LFQNLSFGTGSHYKDFLKFGRISGYAGNRAFRGSASSRSGPGYAVAKPLQSLAHEPLAPQGVKVLLVSTDYADFTVQAKRNPWKFV
jgi:hypothetical protein